MFLCNANVVVTIRLASIFFALFNFVLGDDSAGVLGATEAAVDAGGVLLNGLFQVPEAAFKAGQDLGNAAVDWLGGSQDTSAGSQDTTVGSQDTTAGSQDTTAGSQDTAADINAVPPATDGSASGAESFRQNPDPAPDTVNPAVPVSTPINPQKEDSNDDPVFKLHVSGDQGPPQTAPHDDCDSENSTDSPDSDPCRVATARIIWPSDRGNTEQNSNIQTALTATVKNPGDVRVSEDERGIFFWSAPVTDEQAEKLQETVEGIKEIVKDEPLIMGETPMTARRIQKRAQRAVIQHDAPPHLQFISTPPPDSDSNPNYGFTASNPPDISIIPDYSSFRYAYLEDAGRFILGYWIDLYSSATATDAEFTMNTIIDGTINALQPAGYEWDGGDYGLPGHMLGSISLIAGFQFGVAKKARVTMVKVVLHVSSFLDALVRIKKSLKDKVERSLRVKGYTVVGTGYYGPEIFPESTKVVIKTLIQELIDDYQIVFVSAANNDDILYSQLKVWPAMWASDDSPIITVAGVDLENGK